MEIIMGITVGIDLGTTYSAVATFDKTRGEVTILKNSFNSDFTPSVVCIDEDKITFGEEAKTLQSSGNVNTAAFYKTWMGDENFSMFLNGKNYSSEELSGIYLKQLISDIEENNNVKIDEAVITVPAYFKNKQREATIRAGESAGLKVLKIINEPTAAVIAYGLAGKDTRRVMVYDLGGGTFDVTIAEINNGAVRVLCTNGDHHLGGKDWDGVIKEYLATQFEYEFGINIDDFPEDANDLQVTCEEIKKKLTSLPKVTATVSSQGMIGRYEVTREWFEEETKNLLFKTQSLINECLNEIAENGGGSEIDEVVLVGGSTRMPQVKEMIVREYGKTPITGIDVDTVVARGAAIQAGICQEKTIQLSLGPNRNNTTSTSSQSNGKNVLMLSSDSIKDITAHGLGILVFNPESECFENSIIIKKGSSYNQYFDREYYVKNNSVELYILQGDLPDPFECDILGKYIVDCSYARAQIKVTVSLCYNGNGVVEAKAADETGHSLNVKKSEINTSLDDLIRKLKEEQENNKTPYTKWAGVSNIPSTSKDKYGNPKGSDYDLVLDNTFANHKILIIIASNIPGDPDLSDAVKALNRKGFEVKIINSLPPVRDLKREIYDYCQIWIVSGWEGKMTEEYVDVFEKYFKDGHGLYLWGDNDPYFVDVNPIAERLFGTKLIGNDYGNQVLGIQKGPKEPGIIADHLITTGLVNFYEGITISYIEQCHTVEPLMYDSDRNVVAAFYDEQGRRAIIDGGFTRLYCNWDTAGTDRYVVNAAAWLVNFEKFGYRNANGDKKHKYMRLLLDF